MTNFYEITTVEVRGSREPGETTFKLAVVHANTDEEAYKDVTVSDSVTTNGMGDYTGTLTLTGPERHLWYLLSEGAFVQQVNEGKANWTYDDKVWGLLMTQNPVAYAMSGDASVPGYTVLIYPTTCEKGDDGVMGAGVYSKRRRSSR